MAPVSEPFAMFFFVLLRFCAQLRGGARLASIHRIGRILAKGGQERRSALDLVFIVNPHPPTIPALLLELILNALHIEKITKPAGN